MRLIDADKITAEDFYDCVDMYECMEVINQQPTAYDIDKVVEKLEEAKEGFFIRNGEIFRTVPFEKVIEIVKAGEQHD